MSTPRDLTPPDDVLALIDGLASARKRTDARWLLDSLSAVTGHPPRLISATSIGFGQYRFPYADGTTGTSALAAFAPRKANLVVYVMPGFKDYADELAALGKHKTGACCLYINKLADVDTDVLTAIVTDAVRVMRGRYETDD